MLKQLLGQLLLVLLVDNLIGFYRLLVTVIRPRFSIYFDYALAAVTILQNITITIAVYLYLELIKLAELTICYTFW